MRTPHNNDLEKDVKIYSMFEGKRLVKYNFYDGSTRTWKSPKTELKSGQ
jgi:hypothetical protein